MQRQWWAAMAVSMLLVPSFCSLASLETSRASAAMARGSVPFAAADTASVAYQVDPAHDGRQTDPRFAAPLTQLWSINIGGGGAGAGYPLIAHGLVYVDVPNAGGLGTSVSAYSLDNGTLAWGPVDIGGPQYGFGAIAYDGGRVFAINYDGKLAALDATSGAIDWSEILPGQYSFTAPSTAIDGTVYVGGAGTGGTLYALDEVTGASKWTASVANGERSSPAVDATGVYVSYGCERAYSFTFAGALRWQHNSGSCGGGRTDVLSGGNDYVRDAGNLASEVLGESTGDAVGAFTSDVAPAFHGSMMFTMAAGKLAAIDTTSGRTLWTNSDGPYVTAPLSVNGDVIAGDGVGTVHVIDEATGLSAWSGSAGTVIRAPDEYSGARLSGIAEAEGHLAVPAGDLLTVFGDANARRVRITSGPQDGAAVGATTSFSFKSNRATSTFSCALDQAASSPCTSPVSLTDLADGPHSFTVTASGPEGTSLPAVATFVADQTAPVPVVPSPSSSFSGRTTIGASWFAFDPGSGVASYDVRYRSASVGGAYGSSVYPPSLQATTTTVTSIGVAPGDTICFSVRARDKVGNRSDWTAPSCTSAEIDDRSLAASDGWTQALDDQFVDGTFSGSTLKGATLSLAGVRADRIALVATVCDGCGKVAITFPGLPRAVIDLQSSTTRVSTFVLPVLSKITVGTVAVTIVSRDRLVQIDAIGASKA